MNAAGNVVKAGADIHSQVSQRRFQLRCESIFAAAFDREFQCDYSIEDRAAELRKHLKTFATSGTAGGFIARGLKQLIVGAQNRPHFLMQLGQVLRGSATKTLENRFKQTAQQQKLLSKPIAQTQTCAVRKNERGHSQGHHDAKNHLAHAIHCQAPARTFLVHQHDDGDGDAGQASQLLRSPSRPQTMMAARIARM